MIEASGRMTEHPIYGEQMAVESYELKAPEDTVSMERYLGSGAIKGVGAALASRIVKKFKADTFRIMEEEPERGIRCYACYKLRLDKSAAFAKEHGYDYFTTTLSISPHKNADWLNEIGEELGEQYGIMFLHSDFKKKNGYKRSIELSKKYNLYRQNFCGCEFSRRAYEATEKMKQEAAQK